MKRILLTITGLTPQVVTETLYALMQRDELPEKILLVTTERGKNRAVRDLLDPADGKFLQFCRDFNLYGKIQFDPSCIRIIADAAGNPLEDIRTPEDNRLAADCIMREVQEVCSDKDTMLHLSLAGGRKSMGFLAGYALTIFGRNQDRLSHVLVSEPFESNRDFYYPTPAEHRIFMKDGSSLNAQDAEVDLAEIPFVRLRSELTDDILNGRATFSEVVSAAQNEISPDYRVVLKKSARSLSIFGRELVLPTARFACYYWLARRAEQGLPPVRPKTPEDVRNFRGIMDELYPTNCTEPEKRIDHGKNADDILSLIQENRSRVNKSIKETFGIRAAPFLIESQKKRRGTVYFLNTEKISIQTEP
jgi:CRISPR-associated protein (TIGR02584 family)